jgi:hypothetical protein
MAIRQIHKPAAVLTFKEPPVSIVQDPTRVGPRDGPGALHTIKKSEPHVT